MSSQLSRAGQWLAHSGIQLPNGGVARYYRADVQRNLGVSTEITGYALSAFVFLHQTTEDEEYLEHARAAASFLIDTAWDSQNRIMPFELDPAAFAYFFDCGIIVRGLLALWRITQKQQLLDIAAAIGESMAHDFARSDGGYWPILSLPGKCPVEMDAARWSRSTGCYQLKAAMAWSELAEATGDSWFDKLYEDALDNSFSTHEDFLPGHAERFKVMDRLHAYLYFLEGLLPRAADPRAADPRAADPTCASTLEQGIRRVSGYVQEIGPEFTRCDVLAQLLRVRLCSTAAAAYATEAAELISFQEPGGGYYFGRNGAEWAPHISPVSTAFAMQALEWWQRRDAIAWRSII